MSKISPCLWFDGQAEDAAKFYTSVFPDSRITHISRLGEAKPGEDAAALVVSFEINGEEILALNGGPQFTFTEAISLYVHCETQDEVDDLWDKLSAGGGEQGVCGWLKDKYGVSWQIVPNVMTELLNDPDRNKADRVMQAMMKMGKIDIAALKNAYDAG